MADESKPSLASTAAASLTPATDETLAAPGEATSYELPLVEASSYDLDKELGRGGMGRVLVARDRRLKRVLAIKVSRSDDASARARFAREAVLTARLQHPSIVPVHEAGTWTASGEPFYAMKLVAGRPLDALIAKARTLDERLALIPNVIAVVDALAFAHAQRVIHRDLKPNNVIVGDFGETIVIDWGLAKELGGREVEDEASAGPYRESGPGETALGSAMGTPSYMAPEQAEGERVDERADVYGLGAMLYHVLCGQPPYTGASGVDVMARVVEGPPVPLREREPGAPRDLVAIVEKAMARDRDARYRDAGPLAEDLKRFYRGQLVAAHAYTRGELVRRWLRRNRAVVTVVAIAAVIIAAGSTFAVRRVLVERDRAVAARDDAARLSSSLLVEQGRAELERGHPARAAEAIVLAGDGARGIARDMLLANAMRSLDAEHVHYDAGGRVYALALSADGTHLLAASDSPEVTMWNPGTGAHLALAGHTGVVNDVELDRTGTHAVTASNDGTARIWSLQTGKQTAVLGKPRDADGSEHPRGVRVARFSPNGERVLTTGFDDGEVRLWDAAGKLVARIDPGAATAELIKDGRVLVISEAGEVSEGTLTDEALERRRAEVTVAGETQVAFLDDGRFVTSSRRGQVVVWSAEGAPLGVLPVPAGHGLEALATDPRGVRVAIAGTRFAAVFAGYWQRAGASYRWVEFSADAPPAKDHRWDVLPVERSVAKRALAFSPDGDAVAFADDARVRVFSVEHAMALASLDGHESAIATLAFADEDRVVSAGVDRLAIVWDFTAGRAWTLEGHRDAIYGLAVAGSVLATGSFDHSVRVWDLAHAPELARATSRVSISGASPATFSPDGTRAVLVDDARAHVYTLGVKTTDLVLGGPSDPPPSAVAFAPDGVTVATAHADGSVRLWRASDGALVRTLTGNDAPLIGLVFGDGGRRLVGTGTAKQPVLRAWDLATGELQGQLTIHPSAAPASVSRDGARLAISDNSVTTVFDIASGKQAAHITAGGVAYAGLSPDGTRLATASDLAKAAGADRDTDARVWDAVTGAAISTLHGHGAPVFHVALDTTGHRAVTSSADGTARVWDADTGAPLATLTGHRGQVTCGAFSPDGTLVATGGDDGTLRIWSVGDGKQLLAFPIARTTVYAIAFSPHGDAVAASAGNGTTAVWSLARETRGADVLRSEIAVRSPWELRGGAFVPRGP